MTALFKDMGIDMLKDSPFVILAISWVGDIDWLIVLSIAVAIFRSYIAYKEYKLKVEVKQAKK